MALRAQPGSVGRGDDEALVQWMGVGVRFDRPAGGVPQVVMASTRREAVGLVGGTAVFPVTNMVDLHPLPRDVTARVAAPAVADPDVALQFGLRAVAT